LISCLGSVSRRAAEYFRGSTRCCRRLHRNNCGGSSNLDPISVGGRPWAVSRHAKRSKPPRGSLPKAHEVRRWDSPIRKSPRLDCSPCTLRPPLRSPSRCEHFDSCSAWRLSRCEGSSRPMEDSTMALEALRAERGNVGQLDASRIACRCATTTHPATTLAALCRSVGLARLHSRSHGLTLMPPLA